MTHHECVKFIAGGLSRAESVKRAFTAIIKAQENDVVLIHDAVRPLVTRQLIMRVQQVAREFGAAIPTLPLVDTIKRVAGVDVKGTQGRSTLASAQTPQGFWYGHLARAYEKIGVNLEAFTDESMLLESLGVPVRTVAGERTNIKITEVFDLKLARWLKHEVIR